MKKFWLRLGLSLFLILALSLCVLLLVVNPATYAACEIRIRAAMMQEINRAALEGMDGQIKYTDLIDVQKDANGKITLISANTPLINEITRKVAELARTRTEARAEAGVTIALGTYSGIAFFSGAGGEITFDVQPAGFMDVSFRSEFTAVGINQTRHRIVADISSEFSLILPIRQRKVAVSSEMLICENVIVGEVPDFYFDNSGGSLNFVPSKG